VKAQYRRQSSATNFVALFVSSVLRNLTVVIS